MQQRHGNAAAPQQRVTISSVRCAILSMSWQTLASVSCLLCCAGWARAPHRLVVSLAALVWLTFPADEIVMNGWGAQMLVTQRGLSRLSWQYLHQAKPPSQPYPMVGRHIHVSSRQIHVRFTQASTRVASTRFFFALGKGEGARWVAAKLHRVRAGVDHLRHSGRAE